MDHKIIFEEYTKATNKVKYIKEKAKSLGVYDSDIICELFKSGYKFEELKRANKATYNAGMKKYEKWKENGSPEDEDADALESTEPEQSEPAPSTRVDEENYKPEDYIAHLEKVLKEQEEKMTELISTNQYLEDQKKNLDDEIERLSHEKCRLEAENRKLKIRVQELLERSETTLESTRVDEENTYDMKKLMDENCQLKADLSQSKCAYDEMLKNYNDAMLMNKQLESQLAIEKADNESESRNLKLAYRENEELRTKVQKCEAFIINQMVYVDHSDFGLKNGCLINLDFSKMTEDEKEKFFKSQRRERTIDQ
ncbi:hypothetical protein [Ruminococcus sp. HUN007]|uniref:hypothetical protein n=1 Tax=Ruminococcus sp. HUN007 TaxID=1514668 RepID=UPI0005D28DF8|nr:hypothetical protein [Ruminococcus sp. HUN007]